MSAEEFWHGDFRLVSAYREAHRIKQESEYIAEWRQGVYMREALLSASCAFREWSKGIEYSYPDLPMFTTDVDKRKEDDEKKQLEKNKQIFMSFVAGINKKFEGNE